MIGVIHELDVSIVVTYAGGSFQTTCHWRKSSGMDWDSVAGMDEPRLAKASVWLFLVLGICTKLNSSKVDCKVFTCSR